ncbi:MAG TPA: diacylglycerol kinase [Virgibacillus sp.]|nr:diacylglycerol kinase [Virgibacillus sp.]
MRKARVIYNPTSGREISKKELPIVLERLEEAGYEASAHATTGEGDATEAARSAVERRFDLVVVAGGDGTVNEVISGLAEQDYRPKLGIIPRGTTNDFAKALSIPRDIEKVMDIIVDGESMALDLGKVNDHYFINIAGGGDLTELTYDVPIKMKTMLGQLAYYLKGIEKLPFLKPTHVKIDYDGTVIDEDIMMFLVSNTNSVGGFEKIAPDAKVNDGYFDLLILRKTNLAEFIRLATLALRGAHIEDKNIIYAQAKRIRIEPYDKMLLNIDGEYGGEFPGEIINLKQHIDVFVSDDFLKKEEKDVKEISSSEEE